MFFIYLRYIPCFVLALLSHKRAEMLLMQAPPAHAEIYKGCLAMCEREGFSIDVKTMNLSVGNTVWKDACSMTRYPPARWHFLQNAFWIAGSQVPTNFCLNPDEGVLRYDLSSLVADKLVPARFNPIYTGVDLNSELNEPYPGGPFLRCETLRNLPFFFGDFDPKFHFDYLPNGSDRVRLLLLTNLRGNLIPDVNKATGLLVGGGHINETEEERANPKWSLVVYDHQGYWDLKKKCWVDGPWKRGEEITVGFEEGFHALEKGGTYYFVTDSGRVFAAPPGEKGKPRPMRTVWNDKARRIKLFLTDADTERTWLFTCPGKKGEPAVYFELGQKAEPTPYDPLKLPKATGDDPMRSVLRHARFLVAEKKIKVAEAKP